MAAAIALAVAAAAAGSSSSGGAAPTPSSTPTLGGAPASICQYLVDTDVLNAADRLAQQGASPAQVATVKAQLQKVADIAPQYLQFSASKIIDELGTSNTAQVVPLSRLIAGTCRSRRLP